MINRKHFILLMGFSWLTGNVSQAVSECEALRSRNLYGSQKTSNYSASSNGSTACESYLREIILYEECQVSLADLQEILYVLFDALEHLQIPSGERWSHFTHVKNTEPSCGSFEDTCSSIMPTEPSLSLGGNNDVTVGKSRSNINSVCEEIMEDIKLTVYEVLAQIKCLVSEITNPIECEAEIARLEEMVECLKKKIDVVLAAAGDVSNCYIDRISSVTTCFGTEIARQQQIILALTNQIKQMKNDLLEASISSGSYYNAVEYFPDDSEDTFLYKVIKSAYKTGHLTQILEFSVVLRVQKTMQHQYKVFDALTEAMEEDTGASVSWVIFNTFVETEVLAVCGNKGLRECTSMENGLPVDLVMLLPILLEKSEAVFKTWIPIIRNKAFSALVTAINPTTISVFGKMFKNVTDDLITQAYARDTRYLGGVLSFLESLTWNNHRLLGFQALKREIGTNRDELLRLSITLKKVMEDARTPGPDGEDHTAAFNSLKNSIPTAIQGVVWGTKCQLKANNRFLTFTSNSQYPEYPKNMKLSMTTETGEAAKWIFVSQDIADNTYEFQVRSRSNMNQQILLAPHLPFRYREQKEGTDFLCSSNPDALQAERKNYNWRVSFVSDSQIQLFQVGRGGKLALDGNEPVLGMLFGRLDLIYSWTLSCEY